MRFEAEENGLTFDEPEKYQDLAANSVARTSTQFLYDTCAPRSNTRAVRALRVRCARAHSSWQVPAVQV